MLLLDVVLYLLAPNRCYAHGKLTVPTPRDGISTGRAGLDQNNPVSFESGCDDENTCDAFVCREAGPNPNVPIKRVVAGQELMLQWSFTAFHVGDCSVYISYDVDEPRSQQKYVKIANLFDCKSYPSKRITIPASLPRGRAILRWDWAALHVWPKVEFYVQCVDVEISSASTSSPASLDSFSITNPPIYPDNGNDGVGYRNGFDRGSGQEMTGPSCIDDTINDCARTAPGTARNTDSRRGSRQPTPSPPPPTLSPTGNPTTAKPSPSPPCVPIGDCGAHAWCDQAKYAEWCMAQDSNSCSSVFCQSGSFTAPTSEPTLAAPTLGPTALPTSTGKRCVPTLEGYFTDPAVWSPTCDAQGQANVCVAPICRWEAVLVQASAKRHHFLVSESI